MNCWCILSGRRTCGRRMNAARSVLMRLSLMENSTASAHTKPLVEVSRPSGGATAG